jgi:DHA1 family bicyclomycin/chloramphenicol resistance-like MFS transporter
VPSQPVAPPAARLPYAEFVTLIAALMALNAMAVDIMLPALQQIGADLGVSDPNARQLTLTSYVLGFAVAQLAYGPLSDHFGRKRVLLAGLAVYSVAGLAAAAAGSFALLLGFRVVQGIGAAATRVVAVAVVRDTYEGRRMASVMSLAMMVFMAVPILAPGLGQIVLLFSGWPAIFGLIAVAGMAVTIWSILRLPETLPPERRRPLAPASVLGAFRVVLTNRSAFGYAMATSLIFGVLFAFLNSAQQIYVEIYDLGVWFPVAFSSSAILIAVASFTNSRLVHRLGMRRLAHGALLALAAVSGLLAAISALNDHSAPFPVFFALMTIGLCCFGFIGTNFNALAMEPLGAVAGTAASVLGAMQTFGGGLIGALIGQAYDGTITPLATGFLLLALAAFGVVLVVERGRLFGATHS